MFGAFERMVAMRYLRAKQEEGSVSLIGIFAFVGIALGVMTLIVVMAVRTGFRDDFIDRILGFDGHIYVFATDKYLEDYEDIVQKLEKIQKVKTATPLVEGTALIQIDDYVTGAVVRGISEKDAKKRELIADNIVDGTLDSLADEGSILVGKRLVEKRGLSIGDEVNITSPKSKETAFGSIPNIKTFKIGAIFETGISKFDENVYFVPLASAQKLFDQQGVASNIEIFLHDPNDIHVIRPDVYKAIGDNNYIRDWLQRNKPMMVALDVESNVMFIIITLVICIAAFNIVSSLIMLVKDKARNIAVMRSMGATKGMMTRIFFLTGASIGFTGTALGVTLGVLISTNVEKVRVFLEAITGKTIFDAEIYYLTRLPSKLEMHVVVLTSVTALLLTFIATIYPAWRAARLDPAEALRNE